MDDSRGAMILARATKKQDSESVVEKAMKLELLTKRTQAFVYIKKTLAQRCPISKSAKVKVVESSQCYRHERMARRFHYVFPGTIRVGDKAF